MDWRIAVFQLPIPSDLFPTIISFYDPVIDHVLRKLEKRIRDWYHFTTEPFPENDYKALLRHAKRVIRTTESVAGLDRLF